MLHYSNCETSVTVRKKNSGCIYADCVQFTIPDFHWHVVCSFVGVSIKGSVHLFDGIGRQSESSFFPGNDPHHTQLSGPSYAMVTCEIKL